MCNFRDPKLVAFYFYELTHFLDWIKSTLLFICSTNILVRLLTINMENCLTQKNPKMCDPIIVNPVVKMGPHPAAHPHYPLIRKYPPPPSPVQNSYTENAKGVMYGQAWRVETDCNWVFHKKTKNLIRRITRNCITVISFDLKSNWTNIFYSRSVIK